MRRIVRGFSLIEVLIGLLILSLVVLTSLAVFTARHARMQKAKNLIAAYQALSNEAEIQRRLPYSELAGGVFLSGSTILPDLPSPETSIAVEQPDLRVPMKIVTLSIRWNDGRNSAKLALVRTGGEGGSLW